jgi:hypothetical protein
MSDEFGCPYPAYINRSELRLHIFQTEETIVQPPLRSIAGSW